MNHTPKVELINTVIYSRGSVIGYIPRLKMPIAGDTLEDTLLYIDKVEGGLNLH